MKSIIKLLAVAGITGVVLAGSVAASVGAWHPKGVITKYVQNKTTGGQLLDANTDASAASAKPGDILEYTVVVANEGAPANNNQNDMVGIVITDELPEGVELEGEPAKRTITENIARLKPGEKATKKYSVKVTTEMDGKMVDNKACFVGNSEVNDNEQKGCDLAKTKVSAPPTPPKPEEPKQPEPPKQEVQAAATGADLPDTGAGSLLAPAGAAVALGYIGNMLRLKRRINKQN
ncbi:MAG TPA: hypothetical protein VJ836_05635 [Candidatus Saccharimonadales bacterium]|nr:hypothetical protein [Candidatus Saccharimonadales bacterium]